MYRYRFTIHLGDRVSYIKFIATERVDEDYVEDTILDMYKTGKYTEVDGLTGNKYVNTYDMNRDLIEDYNWWLEDSELMGSSKYFENGLYLN